MRAVNRKDFPDLTATQFEVWKYRHKTGFDFNFLLSRLGLR